MKRLHQILFFVLAFGLPVRPVAHTNNKLVVTHTPAVTVTQFHMHSGGTPEVYGGIHGSSAFATVLQQASIVSLFFFACACILKVSKSPRPTLSNAISPYLRYIYPFHGFW